MRQEIGERLGLRRNQRDDRGQRDPAGEVLPEGPHAGSGAGVVAQRGHRDPQRL